MALKLKRWWWKRTGNIIALFDSYAKTVPQTGQTLTQEHLERARRRIQ